VVTRDDNLMSCLCRLIVASVDRHGKYPVRSLVSEGNVGGS